MKFSLIAALSMASLAVASPVTDSASVRVPNHETTYTNTH